ncbi:MAG: protein translocase subunit SecD [SAR202 cluster bacterium]|nr:protein translocase subunit SecD [SAR202 cluster bacterium]
MLRRLNWKSLLFIVVVVGLSVAALAVQRIHIGSFDRGSDRILGLQLGLDLAGGSHLVYQAGSEEVAPTEDNMDGLVQTISRRINSLGVSEPTIQRLGNDRLIIQLPGVTDIERAKRVIGETASLEIVERVCFDRACTQLKDKPTGLTGGSLESAAATTDQVTERWIISFQMTGDATRDFAQLTQRIFNTLNTDSPDQLAFKLDDEVLVSAVVSSPILTGSGIIQGGFTATEARDIAIQIESGRLPVPISGLSTQVVAPSLGEQSLRESLIAGIIGFALVVFFMAAYYRMSGVVAGLALLCYIAIVLAVFKLLPVTLSLAGVAGFILSLGMALDANVLIFERVKEELRIGRSLALAIQIGFNRAWSSIRDSNVSTLITAAILFFFGQQSANTAVTGFAVTLSLGVLISMFSAITISRNFMVLMAVTPLGRMPKLFTPESVHGRAPETPRTPAAERGA